MIENLSPAIRQEVEPTWNKWPGFVEKFNARVQEVVGEADAGLDQLIEQHATDWGPMGAAFGVLQSRIHGLDTKLDEAGTKLEELLWEILFRDDTSQQDCDILSALHDEICRQLAAQRDALEMTYETLQTRKQGDWARRLYQLAQQELGAGINCSNCGSPFSLKVTWQASNETCPHCDAVNSVSPGPASYAYFGAGVHHLAHEQAFQEWVAEHRAKDAFDKFRHPTAYDHWQYLNSARAYYTKYYQVTQQLHPGFVESHGSVEQAAEAKLAHYTAYDPPVEQQTRDFFGRMLDAARRQDMAALQQALGTMPQNVDLDECAEAAMERRDQAAARLILNIKYDTEGEDEPREAWLREQLQDVYETVKD